MSDNGITTIIHYPIPPHQSRAYQSLVRQKFPVAEALSGQILSLPIGPHILIEEINFCVTAINRFLINCK